MEVGPAWNSRTTKQVKVLWKTVDLLLLVLGMYVVTVCGRPMKQAQMCLRWGPGVRRSKEVQKAMAQRYWKSFLEASYHWWVWLSWIATKFSNGIDCSIIEVSVARKHKSLLGNCETQTNELGGFSHGNVWRWVGVHVLACVHVRV